MRVFISTDDWRLRVMMGEFDSVIIPVAGRYSGLGAKPLSNGKPYYYVPPSLRWFISSYTGRTEPEDIAKAAVEAGQLTAGIMNACDLSHKLGFNWINPAMKPYEKNEAPACQVVGATVCSAFLDTLGVHGPSSEYERLHNYAIHKDYEPLIRGALGCVAYKFSDIIDRSKDLLNVAIAPLFAEGGYQPHGYAGRGILPVCYSQDMMDIIAPLAPDMNVTIFNNWGINFIDQQVKAVNNLRGGLATSNHN